MACTAWTYLRSCCFKRPGVYSAPLEWDSGMRAHVILPPSPPPPPFHFFPRTLREVSWTVPSTHEHCTPLGGRTFRENLETSPKHFPLLFSYRRTHSYVSFNCGKLFLSPNPLGCLYRLERNVMLPRSFFFFSLGKRWNECSQVRILRKPHSIDILM